MMRNFIENVREILLIMHDDRCAINRYLRQRDMTIISHIKEIATRTYNAFLEDPSPSGFLKYLVDSSLYYRHIVNYYGTYSILYISITIMFVAVISDVFETVKYSVNCVTTYLLNLPPLSESPVSLEVSVSSEDFEQEQNQDQDSEPSKKKGKFTFRGVISIVFATITGFLVGLNMVTDSPDLPQYSFQDPASSTMEGIHLFNLHVLTEIIFIILVVSCLLFKIIYNHMEIENNKINSFSHSSKIEIAWTSFPVIILLTLAYPSFSLLYSMDEIYNPEFTFKVTGYQWYWGYVTSDFDSCLKTHNLKSTNYMLIDEGLKKSGCFFRKLETNRRLSLPTNTHIRLLINAVDVLHSWTIPSFGIKVDACPGRLNQTNLLIKRIGIFFGQCSEICGVNHGFMSIAVMVMSSLQYNYLIISNP